MRKRCCIICLKPLAPPRRSGYCAACKALYAQMKGANSPCRRIHPDLVQQHIEEYAAKAAQQLPLFERFVPNTEH